MPHAPRPFAASEIESNATLASSLPEVVRANPWKRWGRWIKVLAVLSVAIGLGIACYKAWGQLQDQPIAWQEINWLRISVAVLAYVVTMLLSGLFWRQVLAASHSPLPLLIAWRAFAISQLAKYVPGKAMVLVVRAGMVSAYGVSAGAVISSSIIETLLWMFVGAQIACLFLLFVDSGSAALRILILFSLCVCGLITVPPNFQKILGLVNRIRKRPQREPNSRPIFDWRTYFWGVVTLSVSWLFAGFSAWLTITSLPDIEFGLDRYGLVLATVAMATVGGFASLLPGGIGVRELVIIPMLSPSIGTLNAVLAAVMIRLTWIVAEAILSVTIELVFRFTRRSL